MWWCGIVVKTVAYAMCCVMSDVEKHAICCVAMSDVVVWCKIKMWWCDVKSRCGGVMWCGICCDWCWMWVWCGIVVDVECDCVMWNMWWCEMVVGGRLRCNWCDVRCRIWWSEVRCVATLNVCEMWRGTCGICSNVMCNGGVMWNGVVWNGPCAVKGGVM